MLCGLCKKHCGLVLSFEKVNNLFQNCELFLAKGS